MPINKHGDIIMITASFTVEEFKKAQAIDKLTIVSGPNGRFMSNGKKSLGTVAKDIDFEGFPLQVIEATDEGTGVVAYILCNTSRYKEERTL